MLTYHEKYVNWYKTLSDEEKKLTLAEVTPLFMEYLKIKKCDRELATNILWVQFVMGEEQMRLANLLTKLQQQLNDLKPSPVVAE